MVSECVIVVVRAVVVDVEAVDSIGVLVVDWVVDVVDASEDVGRIDIMLVDGDGVVTVGKGVFYKNMQIRGYLLYIKIERKNVVTIPEHV